MPRFVPILVRLVGVVIPLAGAVAAGRLLAPYLPEFTEWVGTLGAWGPLAFMAVYILGVICLMPVFLLTIASGAVFGVTHAALYVMTASLAGALCSFLIARYLIRDKVGRRIAKDPKLSAIDRAVGQDGRRLVFFLRLSPVVPFVLTNYALGATRVKLFDFMLGTLGLAPIVISYAAFGKAAGATNATGESALSWPVLAVGIIATVLLGWIIARIARRAIAEAEEPALEQSHSDATHSGVIEGAPDGKVHAAHTRALTATALATVGLPDVEGGDEDDDTSTAHSVPQR